MPASLSPVTARRRLLLAATALLALGASIEPPRAFARAAISPFDRAERMQEALEGRPEQQRTRRDYDRVLAAYRAIYHDNPANTKATDAVAAVAGLLAEEGRVFQDEKALRDSVGQYEFLRHEYPGSRLRISALLDEGEIYRQDLHDRSAAKAIYADFVKTYPGSPLADHARAELKAIRREESAAKHGHLSSTYPETTASASPDGAAEGTPVYGAFSRAYGAKSRRHSTVLDAARASHEIAPSAEPARAAPTNEHTNELTRLQAQAASSGQPTAESAAPTPAQTAPEPKPEAHLSEARLNAVPPPRNGRLPLVTGVRHWSTPVYTRVAIDVQDQVQYEAARVPNPDRIYFDLHGAKVAPELIGKSVDVTDDGFLKRIRVAQFSNDVTRIVLDVSQVSEYSAFFLPNPWRLIIDIHGVGDIHGVKPGTKSQPVETVATTAEQTKPMETTSVRPPAAVDQPWNTGPGLDPAPRGPEPTSERAGKAAVVTTSSAKSTTAKRSLRDIASLGQQPDRVKATRRPTTEPIAASVAGTTRATEQPGTLALAPGATTASVATNDGETVKPAVMPAPEIADGSSSSRQERRKNKTGHGAPEMEQGAAGGSHEAMPTAVGERSLVRALGLKIGRIVVDAGHGGHDSGTLGPGGIQEKEVVLDVALRLGKLLKQRLGADVIYTRDDDTFIPLETRTALANKAQADLFISVHANSSSDPTARGVETYYLNFTTSPDALEVAARENAVSDESIHELSGLVKKITLKDKIDESREFAADVENSLYTGLEAGNPGLKDRGVKKAPFVVLIGANMPSILAEISFLTNPSDASQLRDPAYRERIAESLYRGITKYISGLSGLRLAQSGGGSAGQ